MRNDLINAILSEDLGQDEFSNSPDAGVFRQLRHAFDEACIECLESDLSNKDLPRTPITSADGPPDWDRLFEATYELPPVGTHKLRRAVLLLRTSTEQSTRTSTSALPSDAIMRAIRTHGGTLWQTESGELRFVFRGAGPALAALDQLRSLIPQEGSPWRAAIDTGWVECVRAPGVGITFNGGPLHRCWQLFADHSSDLALASSDIRDEARQERDAALRADEAARSVTGLRAELRDMLAPLVRLGPIQIALDLLRRNHRWLTQPTLGSAESLGTTPHSELWATKIAPDEEVMWRLAPASSSTTNSTRHLRQLSIGNDLVASGAIELRGLDVRVHGAAFVAASAEGVWHAFVATRTDGGEFDPRGDDEIFFVRVGKPTLKSNQSMGLLVAVEQGYLAHASTSCFAEGLDFQVADVLEEIICAETSRLMSEAISACPVPHEPIRQKLKGWVLDSGPQARRLARRAKELEARSHNRLMRLGM